MASTQGVRKMRFTVKAVPPFSFDLSARIFFDGDKQIRRYENGRFWQTLRANGKLILTVMKALGSVEEPALSVELRSDSKVLNSDVRVVGDLVRSIFSLAFDLGPFYDEVKDDETMSRLTNELRGLRGPTTATVFEALVDSIIEQQISLSVAHILESKVIKAFGDALEIDDEVHYAYPTPQSMASATVEQLRRCGLSGRKAEYLRNISRLVVEGSLDMEKMKDYDDIEEIIRELDEVKGVGLWTAELTMVRGMHKLEALPADDIGLRRVISHYYCNDRKISSQEARKIAEKWGHWKGLAAYYLVVAEMLGMWL